MNNEDKVSFVPATLLPKGWIWKMYYDGSGCLLSPEKKEFMIYDLETNECKFDKDSDYDFFPLSYYYGDGVEIFFLFHITMAMELILKTLNLLSIWKKKY